MRTIIVGNADMPERQRQWIDSFDRIIRFNAPPLSHVHAAMRTDCLYLANTSKQVFGHLTSRTWLESPAFKNAQQVILAQAPEIVAHYRGRQPLLERLFKRPNDHTSLCASVCASHGKPLQYFPASQFTAACEVLQLDMDSPKPYLPSSGFLALFKTWSERQTGDEVHLAGFTFQGWKRHSWAAERRHAEALANQGLFIHTPENDE